MSEYKTLGDKNRDEFDKLFSKRFEGSEIACEQAHLFGYREPAKRGKVCVKRPILLASSRLRLPFQTSEPARRLGLRFSGVRGLRSEFFVTPLPAILD